MPHPDNSGWMSMLAGHPVRPARLTSVDEVAARRALLDLGAANAELPDIGSSHHVEIGARDGAPLMAEVYVPAADPPFPVLLYMHGGAWCLGSSAATRRLGHRFAEHGFLVVNLDYALAPEHPFPAAVADVVYAARWATVAAHAYGGDGGRLSVAGDSAGAQLAAAAVTYLAGGSDRPLEEHDLAGVQVEFAAALLLYGVFDFPLLVRHPGSNVGSLEVMFLQAHLGPNYLALFRDPLISPVYSAQLSVFPPTYLSCGDEDSLLGQTLSMTAALAAANVPTTCSVVAGADHAFFQLEHVLAQAHPEVERALSWLGRMVAFPPARVDSPQHPQTRARDALAGVR